MRWPGVSSGGGARRCGQSPGAGTPAGQDPPRIGPPPQHVSVGAGLRLGYPSRVWAAAELLREVNERCLQVAELTGSWAHRWGRMRRCALGLRSGGGAVRGREEEVCVWGCVRVGEIGAVALEPRSGEEGSRVFR